jgi:hypothetical protein
MGSDDVKTLIEKRASALADAFTSEDVQKLMSFFSKDVDFSDIGTPPAKYPQYKSSSAFPRFPMAQQNLFQFPIFTNKSIAMSAYNLNNASLHGFYEMMYGNLHSLTIANVTVSGSTPEFVTWEMDIGFVMKVDDEHLGVKKDQKVVMKGAALQWWREEDGE